MSLLSVWSIHWLKYILSYLLLFESILFFVSLVRCYVQRVFAINKCYQCIFRELSSMICPIGTSSRVWGRATRTSTTALVGCTRREPRSTCRRMTSQCFPTSLSEFHQATLTSASFMDNDYCSTDTRVTFMKTFIKFEIIAPLKFYLLLYPIHVAPWSFP